LKNSFPQNFKALLFQSFSILKRKKREREEGRKEGGEEGRKEGPTAILLT